MWFPNQVLDGNLLFPKVMKLSAQFQQSGFMKCLQGHALSLEVISSPGTHHYNNQEQYLTIIQQKVVSREFAKQIIAKQINK